MFKNLFNRQTAPVQVAQQPSGKYPAIVEHIHHEFETAADRLLIEAKQHIADAATSEVEKAKRLKAIGFSQAEQAVKGVQKIQKAELSTKQLALLHYYRVNYPHNKFITEEQVKEICRKYNLICGGINRYKGFVPDEKLKLIESFKLRKEDRGLMADNGMFFKGGEVRRGGGFWHIYKGNEPSILKNAFQSDDRINFYSNDSLNLFGYKDKGWIQQFRIEPSQLHICAPVKDMDMTGMTIEDGYKMKTIHVPDPVVLQPVDGGYLILAAWGDEASDPIVVNQNHN